MFLKIKNFIFTLEQILKKNELSKIFKLQLLMIFNGMIELLGFSAIAPFIYFSVKIGTIFENKYVKIIHENIYKFNSELEFLVLFGLCCIFLTIIISVCNFITNYKIFSLSQFLNLNIKKRLYKKYLELNYIKHLEVNHSKLINNIADNVLRVTDGILLSLLVINLKIIVAILITAFLFFVNYKISITVLTIFGIFYCVVYLITNKKNFKLGYELTKYNEGFASNLFPSLINIKNTKIFSLEKFFFKKSVFYLEQIKNIKIYSNSISILPRQMLDVLLVIFVISYLLFIIKKDGNITDSIAIFGIFVYGANKLLPSVHQIFTCITTLKQNLPAYDEIFLDLKNSLIEKKINDEKVVFNQKLEIKNINFKYPKSKNYIYKNLNFVIEKGDKIGLFGSSGIGKTTFVDILTGLLLIDNSQTFLDGKKVEDDKIKNLTKLFGYVPQNPFLLNWTIRNNISLGDENPSEERIVECLKKAQCDFVFELPKTIDTMVTDKINFSGGQTQRLAIARSFYQNREITIFDEPTSSIDKENEKIILENIYNYFGKKTLILITHNKENLKNCNKVFYIKKIKNEILFEPRNV